MRAVNGPFAVTADLPVRRKVMQPLNAGGDEMLMRQSSTRHGYVRCAREEKPG